MKKLIASFTAVLILLTLTACGGGGDTYNAPSHNSPPATEPATEPVTKPEPSSRTIFVYNPNTPEIGTSDGTNYFTLATEPTTNARDGFIAIGDILHGIDDTGTSIITQRLPIEPDEVAISGDIWSFQNIDPVTAQSLGGMAKWYTRIYQGSFEYGMWWMNQWQTVSVVVTNSGDIVMTDTVGRLRSVTEPGLTINFAAHNGIMAHSLDAVNLLATIRDTGADTRVYGTTNHFLSAMKEWVEADGVWYSWNGYIWDGANFTEQSTSLSTFINTGPEYAFLVGVGSRIEHSESVTYWVECNTGWLYRHTPSINALETVIRLWQGSGLRMDGIASAADIKPVLTADNLFFGWSGTIWKYNFNDALVSSFMAGVEIWGM